MTTKRRDPFKVRRLRQIVQIVFLLVLTFLLVKAFFGRVLGSWVPLLALTLTITILTLILGRVWCGWVCPVNTVLDWVHFDGAIERGARLSDRWRTVKYVLLFLILAAEPLGLWRSISALIGGISQGTGLPPNQRLLMGGGVLALSLAAIVSLDAIAEHFWCRYLCPLGGAVALLSKIAPMRRIVRVHCNDCSVCVDACPLGAIDPRHGFVNDPGECTVCIDCLTSCTSSSNGFQFLRPELFTRRLSAVEPGQVTSGAQR
jgi:ferredoxin-type protein NapH